ncbi:MAG: hypothetical protein ACJATV_000069 [Granulosicoccus sp.]|jgi:hypothetical protein
MGLRLVIKKQHYSRHPILNSELYKDSPKNQLISFLKVKILKANELFR